MERVFYAVRAPNREGLYRLKPLDAPDQVYQQELILKDNADGSHEAKFGKPQANTPEILLGSDEPDGTLKFGGPEPGGF